jgi:ABC-type glycerol-3-phosphate transport system substrate-binding protein
MHEVVGRLAAGTADGSINKIAWTGRWVEPNGAFAAGTVGMHHAHSPAYFAIKGQGPWVSQQTLGATHAPGGWATPNSHGLGISKGSKSPELAWEFLKMMTEEEWALRFGTTYKVLPGNAAADPKIIASFEKDDPLAVEVLKTQLEFTDRQTGNWRTAADSRIKEAFWPELQAALLGQKPVKEALDEADRKVARVLRRA